MAEQTAPTTPRAEAPARSTCAAAHDRVVVAGMTDEIHLE